MLDGLYREWQPCGNALDYYGSPAVQWHMCEGSYPTTRGYTCGLWSLFHVLMVHSTDAAATVRGRSC